MIEGAWSVPRYWGWRVWRHYPACAKTAIEQLGLSGRVFTDLFQGWLLYHFHPRVRVHSTWEYVAGPVRWAEEQAAWSGGDVLSATARSARAIRGSGVVSGPSARQAARPYPDAMRDGRFYPCEAGQRGLGLYSFHQAGSTPPFFALTSSASA
jgi:hypothetical protein